ncbi:hypothetical protein CDD83_8935 [Cordyceps sp. RAO-2017]|nr:hypothetical protein CDD83_8935 [Cordyceps sp. RAO-2017]
MRHSGVRGVAAALLFSRAAFALSLWTSADAIPAGVPEACRKALARDIACGDSLVTAAQALSGRALGRGAAARYCTQACHDSLQAFRAEVEQHCGDAAHRMFPNSSLEQSGAVLASGLLWAYSLTCIRDSSGFCLEELYNGTREACSQCALQYGTVMAGSPWGQGAVSRESFSSLLSSCGSDPTSYSIPPPQASSPHGSPSLSAPDAGMHEPADAAGGRAGTKAASPACSGETYIVREGDTCVSIASAAGVATDRMIDLNRLDYDCSALAVGMKLCLQDACATHTVMANETCSSITKGREFSGIQLRSWNP